MKNNKSKIKQRQLDNGNYILKYEYIDKYGYNGVIWIETKTVTDKIINRLLKNGI